MIIVFFWLAFALLIGVWASRLNRSGFLWFLFSCILSPLICGILLLLGGKANNDKEILENYEKLKKTREDFLELYCANENAVKTNPILVNKFNELSPMEISSDSKLTVPEIERFIDMILMEVTRYESNKVNAAEEKQEDHLDSLEKLKKLLDIQAITKDEYQEKKEKILSQI